MTEGNTQEQALERRKVSLVGFEEDNPEHIKDYFSICFDGARASLVNLLADRDAQVELIFPYQTMRDFDPEQYSAAFEALPEEFRRSVGDYKVGLWTRLASDSRALQNLADNPLKQRRWKERYSKDGQLPQSEIFDVSLAVVQEHIKRTEAACTSFPWLESLFYDGVDILIEQRPRTPEEQANYEKLLERKASQEQLQRAPHYTRRRTAVDRKPIETVGVDEPEDHGDYRIIRFAEGFRDPFSDQNQMLFYLRDFGVTGVGKEGPIIGLSQNAGLVNSITLKYNPYDEFHDACKQIELGYHIFNLEQKVGSQVKLMERVRGLLEKETIKGLTADQLFDVKTHVVAESAGYVKKAAEVMASIDVHDPLYPFFAQAMRRVSSLFSKLKVRMPAEVTPQNLDLVRRDFKLQDTAQEIALACQYAHSQYLRAVQIQQSEGTLQRHLEGMVRSLGSIDSGIQVLKKQGGRMLEGMGAQLSLLRGISRGLSTQTDVLGQMHGLMEKAFGQEEQKPRPAPEPDSGEDQPK